MFVKDHLFEPKNNVLEIKSLVKLKMLLVKPPTYKGFNIIIRYR